MGLLTNGSVSFMLILFISIVQGFREGYNATKDQFSYHAHIDVLDAGGKKQGDCNGVVITSRFVLTSYSCVISGRSFRIKLGSLIPGEEDDDSAYNEVTTKRIYVPPGIASVTPSTIHNYVALLQVEVEIPFDDHISKAAITPTIAITMNEFGEAKIVDSNYNAIATGYYNNSDPDGPDHLQWLNMRVVSLSNCNYFHKDLLENSLCARCEEIDGSDHGSLCEEENVPLVRTNGLDKVLIGILKKADETCISGGLNLFIDIEHFANWIYQTIIEIKTHQVVHIASQTEFPYHVHIEVHRGPELSNTNNCSGAVINSLFVITSHSCVWNGRKFRIILGSLNPGDSHDNPAFDQVTQILPLVHPDNIGTHQGIALLQLEEKILFNDHIQPAILPTLDTSEFGPDDHAISSGYFLDESMHLQSMYMRVTPISNCTEYFNVNLLQQPVVCVHSEPFAAIYGRISLCRDSGVPLVLNSDRKTLLGILEAPDRNCKSHGQISLFIDVKRYVNWITEVVNEKTTQL